MTHSDAQHLINNHFKRLWTDWNPSDAEIGVWQDVLARYDYDLAKTAISQCFANQEKNWKRPVVKRFKVSAGFLTPQSKTDFTSYTNIYIKCIANEKEPALVGWEVPLFTKHQNDPDYVKRAAECTRKKHEQIYGGSFITIEKEKLRFGPPATDQEKIEVLRAEAAKGSDFAKIMLEKNILNPVAALSLPEVEDAPTYNERN